MRAATPVKPSSESQPGACQVTAWPWVTMGGSELPQVAAALMPQSKLCVSVIECQLSRAWPSRLSSLPGWERWSASICTIAVWLGAAEQLLGTPKTLKSFVFAIPKWVQNSLPPSTVLWFCDCRHHQIAFGRAFLVQLELCRVSLRYVFLAGLFCRFVNASKPSISAWNIMLRFMVLCIRDCSPRTSAE